MLNKNTIARFYVIARHWLSALTKGIHRSNLSCGRTLARLLRRNFVSPRNDVEKLTFRPFNRSTFQPAFTLAEVLIVLGIIGVVAEYTIPTLVANTQKQIYVTSLQKAFSTWNQALIQMANDGGCIGDLSCFFDSADLHTMGDKIATYFKVVKNCDTTTSGCFSDTVATTFDGTTPTSGNDSTSYYRFITADGMSISLATPSISCSNSTDALTKMCMTNVYIDVNGLKKPNALGRDIFRFVIDNDKGPALYPMGGAKFNYWKTNNRCDYGYNGGTNKSGYYCPGRIIDEGWQMSY
ncbi:MAG: type II secretion system protein [Candidatus Gastranaerophilaceae bacterium]